MNKLWKRGLCLAAMCCMLAAVLPFGAFAATGAEGALERDWLQDQSYTLADPAPWNLSELRKVVDVRDPRSVAAYWVWSVTRLTDSFDDGMEMMKYLFADLEPYGSSFVPGGAKGHAGWDDYFTDRLKDADYKWLPRAYFNGATADNGFKPRRPLTIELHYNEPNTNAANEQSYASLGRLNIVYWVQSFAGGNQVTINLSRFAGSERWYVTNGAASTTLFYQQPANSIARNTPTDESTQAQHASYYSILPDRDPGSASSLPFTDVPSSGLYADAVRWAYEKGVTTGTSATTFGTRDTCTRAQVVTFLWRAAGKPKAEQLAASSFIDVNSDDYFFDAVLWAVEQSVTGGTAPNVFSPNATCSTAQIVTFLYRVHNPGKNGWYEDAREWAEKNGYLDGLSITVSPDVPCPRGDVVALLYRAYG